MHSFIPVRRIGCHSSRVVRRLHVRRDAQLSLMNGPPMNDEKAQIAYEILRYLIDNPKAEDTLEGIVTWWLMERSIKQQTLSVKQALEMLVANRLLISQTGRDSQTYYKINRRQRKKIISLLQQKS
jgi:hypothetical protein